MRNVIGIDVFAGRRRGGEEGDAEAPLHSGHSSKALQWRQAAAGSESPRGEKERGEGTVARYRSSIA